MVTVSQWREGETVGSLSLLAILSNKVIELVIGLVRNLFPKPGWRASGKYSKYGLPPTDTQKRKEKDVLRSFLNVT